MHIIDVKEIFTSVCSNLIQKEYTDHEVKEAHTPQSGIEAIPA